MATGTRHRPQMDCTDFEHLAAHAPEHGILECDVTVFSEPEGGKYRSSLTVGFGHTVNLPGLDHTGDRGVQGLRPLTG